MNRTKYISISILMRLEQQILLHIIFSSQGQDQSCILDGEKWNADILMPVPSNV